MNLPDLKFDRRRKRVDKCPCGKSNRDLKFAPFVGYDDKGYCHACGTTFLPELKEKQFNYKYSPSIKDELKPIDFIPRKTLVKSLEKGIHLYNNNNFILGLKNRFRLTDNQVARIIHDYKIGNSKKWAGSVTFPYIDIDGNVRQIKAMDYCPQTCKRVKEPKQRIAYLGKEILKRSDANLSICFFGEHLLANNPKKKVGIVESEKTAIVASVYFPDFVWLARGGKNGCKWLEKDVVRPLSNREGIVYLFPDLSKPTEKVNAFDLWNRERFIIQCMVGTTRIEVSDLLERKATERERNQGADLADYLQK